MHRRYLKLYPPVKPGKLIRAPKSNSLQKNFFLFHFIPQTKLKTKPTKNCTLPIKPHSELRALCFYEEPGIRMPLSIGLCELAGCISWFVKPRPCATTGAKQVRHRAIDKGIRAAACATKGSSSKHLIFGSFYQVLAMEIDTNTEET
jgi:hypothetical protein